MVVHYRTSEEGFGVGSNHYPSPNLSCLLFCPHSLAISRISSRSRLPISVLFIVGPSRVWRVCVRRRFISSGLARGLFVRVSEYCPGGSVRLRDSRPSGSSVSMGCCAAWARSRITDAAHIRNRVLVRVLRLLASARVWAPVTR